MNKNDILSSLTVVQVALTVGQIYSIIKIEAIFLLMAELYHLFLNGNMVPHSAGLH